MIKVTQRTVAVAVVLLAAIGWGGLTACGPDDAAGSPAGG